MKTKQSKTAVIVKKIETH